MFHRRFICILITLGVFFASSGQVLEDSVYVHFRQSKTLIDTTYMDNASAFGHIRKAVELYHQPDSDFVLLDVKVVGGASPEGSVKFNDWLSRERATRIYDYMQSRMILPDSITSHTFLGRDWRGLRTMVVADGKVPYKADVLRVIDEIIEKNANGAKESDSDLLRLKQLHRGVPYLYLYYNLFPSLRQANVVLTFGRPIKIARIEEEKPMVHETIVEEDLSIIDVQLAPMAVEKPFYMALKSNLIADALCLPEIGAEFYLGKDLSVVGNWMYGWWDKDRVHRYWRAYGGDLALRWWFGKAARKKPLTGHHLGVYGGVVTYDFEFGGKGHMGGRPGHNLWDRCMHYFGIEYGYSLPIARRWNIDFTAGLGYMGGKYVEYIPKGRCYMWQATKQKHWFGPTKLEVSLVWLLGHGNYNKKGVKK